MGCKSHYTFDFFSALMIDKGAAHMRLARF